MLQLWCIRKTHHNCLWSFSSPSCSGLHG